MTVIIKLGGSLLTLPDLRTRLLDVLAERSGENCLFICGGGISADVVREWSRIYQLDDETAHRLAIASMDFNNRLLQSLMNWNVVSTQQQADFYWSKENVPLLLRSEDSIFHEESAKKRFPHLKLPSSWDVTSDSIAAWTAIQWAATELLLLKSVPAPLGLSALQACENQLIDRWFPQLSSHVSRISWCNVRSSPVFIERWFADEIF